MLKLLGSITVEIHRLAHKKSFLEKNWRLNKQWFSYPFWYYYIKIWKDTTHNVLKMCAKYTVLLSIHIQSGPCE